MPRLIDSNISTGTRSHSSYFSRCGIDRPWLSALAGLHQPSAYVFTNLSYLDPSKSREALVPGIISNGDRLFLSRQIHALADDSRKLHKSY